MNGQIVNLKNSDEIYCPECAKPIKRNAVICPNCKIQLKALVAERIENNEIIVNQKSIENQEIKYLMIPFIAPQAVTVESNKFIELNIMYDTGIR